MATISRFLHFPKRSFFLFGPRGTGKSTLIKERFKDASYFDLLDPVTFRTLSAHPEYLKEYILARPSTAAVLLDEIQKLPSLLPLVHKLIEERACPQFVLTGSSARKLKRGGVDLLAGRALLCHLYPFTAAELGTLFSFDKALRHGMLPLVMNAEEPDRVLKAYATLYLREEVQMEGLVRNIGNFARFLESISFSHASVLNISNVARECGIARKVVAGYLDILEDLLLGYRLNVFTKRAKRELSVHPKFYLFDAGVYRSLRPRGPLDRAEEIEGHALEGLVEQHLRAWVSYSNKDYGLYFWRTRSGLEVDFILYGADGIF
ncbi:MAG: AAA family ATPase, partial [bacterium]